MGIQINKQRAFNTLQLSFDRMVLIDVIISLQVIFFLEIQEKLLHINTYQPSIILLNLYNNLIEYERKFYNIH